jgi:hypothetical protein
MEIDKGYQESLVNLQQEGILSPILFNIYLTSFDTNLYLIKEDCDSSVISFTEIKNPKYKNIE